MSFSTLVKDLLKLRSRDRFAERVRRRLIARGMVSSEAVYSPETFAIQEGTRSLFLENLFAVLHHLWPWQRGAEIERWVGSIVETQAPEPATYEEAKDDLLPGLRHPVTFRATALLGGDGAESAAQVCGRPLTPNLGIYLLLDQPNSMRYVGEPLLERWGVSFEVAFGQALENLRRRSQGPLRQLGGGVAVSPWQDHYDSARLLLSDVVAQIEAPGDPVALAPGRSVLILTGDREAGSLSAAMRWALEAWENEPRPLSLLPVVRRGGEWQELVLPRGHDSFDLLCELRVREAAQLYEEQTPALQAWCERRGEDIYVGRLLATKHNDTGRFNSVAVWSRGVDTLLPRAEQVAFFDPDAEGGGKSLAVVDFDLVESRLGSALEPTEHAPERFRVCTFPGEEAIVELRQLQERRTVARGGGPSG